MWNTRREYAEILETTYLRVWRRRFGAYGIDTEAAWVARSSSIAAASPDDGADDRIEHVVAGEREISG